METMEEKKERIDWVEAKILQKTVIKDKNGLYLIITRAIDGLGARPGKDDLCGGSVDKKDFKEDFHSIALSREAFEETGLKISDFRIVHVQSGVKISGEVGILCLGYVCVINESEPEIKLSGEHYKFRWVSRDEALNADFGDDGGFHKAIVEKS